MDYQKGNIDKKIKPFLAQIEAAVEKLGSMGQEQQNDPSEEIGGQIFKTVQDVDNFLQETKLKMQNLIDSLGLASS